MQVYCSASCAPYGQLGKENQRQSPQTGRSIYTAAGVASDLSLEEKRSNALATWRADLNERKQSARRTGKILNVIEPKNENEGDGGMHGTQRNTESNGGKPADARQLVPVSDSPPQSLDVVTSRSQSLIDESVQHLSELMRSISPKKNGDQNVQLTVQQVNAACNCAKQISQMIKLKVDFAREVRKTK